MKEFINYPSLIEDAMRRVVAQTLEHTAKYGLKNDRHFYISFATNAFGVEMPEKTRQQYPKEITIVLQHQFHDLIVDKNKFSVVLLFGGIPEKIVVPFTALTKFTDPSEDFTLEFSTIDQMNSDKNTEITSSETSNEHALADVITLDSFRNKNKK